MTNVETKLNIVKDDFILTSNYGSTVQREQYCFRAKLIVVPWESLDSKGG